ncbi:MAG: carboxypeptidase-like regulatory domain-containing protein [Candidatus Sulfopaludibacter sp.]|nr:carboxypeptidase-like regulatory domain-containing protein [Candidatus Sulfopaludibacter sp.]
MRTVLLIFATVLTGWTQAQFSGRVTNSITGLPVAKATVRLAPVAGRAGYVRTSGAAGEFRFEGISPGDYRLGMERRGFSPVVHSAGKGVPGGSVIHLTAGQNLADLDLLATPLPIVTGTVTEGPGEGEPVPRAIIEILAQRWSIAGRWYEEIDTAANDQGQFRAPELEPGRYYFYARRPDEGPLTEVVKDASGKGEVCLAGVYYPNAPSIEGASAVEVRAGQEVTGIGLRLAWSPCFHARGRTTGPDVEEVQMIRRRQDTPLPWESREADRATDGTFDIPGVVAGDYLVSAIGHRGPKGPAQEVTVESRDLEGLAVSGENVSFNARVQVEGDGAPPLSSVYLLLETVTGPGNARFTTVPVQPDGTARLGRITPARYTLAAGSSQGGVYVKSVKAGPEEWPSPVLDFRGGSPPELEIVVGLGTGQVQGTVQWPDPSEGAVPVAAGDAMRAVLVPQESRAGIRGAWFAELDQNGAFTFSEIPPGKYFVFAAANLEEALWMNREFIGLVQGSGAPVDLPEKGNVQVEAPVLPAAVAQRAMESIR